MKFVLLSILSILLMGCESKKEIEKMLVSFYNNHEGINDETRDSLFSKTLLKKIKAVREFSRKDAERIKNSNSTTDKGFIVEGAIYSSLYDGYSKFLIKNIEMIDNNAIVLIEFEFNSKPITKWTDTILLINDKGWKIDNVKFDSKITPVEDLIYILDPIIFDDNFFRDIVTNQSGQKLKLLLDRKNNNYSIDFNNQKATLKCKDSTEKIYADANYQLSFKENEIVLIKDNQPLFISKFPISFDKVNEADNYFLKNDYPEKELHALKINNETELNKYFGAATTMGKKGTPTKIDFNKYFAVAIIGKTNNLGNSLWIMGLYYENKNLLISTTITPLENEKKQSYNSRPTKILLFEKKYQGTISLELK